MILFHFTGGIKTPEVIIEKLSKNFGHVRALRNVDLHIKDGEYLGIVGPSGCGKTTLINCITGIVEPSEGQVIIDGKNVTEGGIPIEERGFSMVFQNIALFPHMNVVQNVEYPSVVKDIPTEEAKERTDDSLKLVDLLEEKQLFPRQISGGAQQKVSVARALATQAKLIILDEPISALDLKVRVELRYEILRLVKELGLTAIHITHDQEEVMSISDRVVLMRAGEIIEINTPRDLYMNPKSLFTLHFVGECNFLEGYIREISDSYSIIRFRNNIDFKLMKKITEFDRGAPIVFTIRPENTTVKNFSKDSTEEIKGKLIETRFFGSYYRYSIKLETDDIVFVDQISEYAQSFNEEITVQFNPQHVLIFPAPPDGLMEELSLE